MDNIEALPAVQEMTSEIERLEVLAGAYRVTNNDEYRQSAEDLKRVKAAQKALEDTRTSITVPINNSLKRINNFFRAPADRLREVEQRIKGALTRYADEQERLRREEQRRLDEIARKERERLAKLQQEAEARARAEQERLRRQAEEAAAAGRAAEAAKLAAKAERAEERATAKVAELQEREAMVVAPVVNRDPPKVAGISTRIVWKYEIVKPELLPPKFLMPDEQKIAAQVQALKADADIPGVRVWSERQLASGVAA